MTLGLTEIVVLLLGLGGLCLFGFGLWQFHLGRRTATESGAETGDAHADIAALIRGGEERLLAMVAKLEAGQQERLDGLKSEISAVKAEIDWLTGEHMIEQAINMAREGISAEEISADLGLSFDAANTITTMRRH